jgi:hypothetical protein
MRVFSFQSEGFVDDLLTTGVGVNDTYSMSEASSYKYEHYLHDHLLKHGIALDEDCAPIWCFANYPSDNDLSLGEAILSSYLSITRWYQFSYRYLIELEVPDDQGVFLYDDLKNEEEHKVCDYSIMDKSRVITKVIPSITREAVVGVYKFNNANIEDFTPEVFYENPNIESSVLQEMVQAHVNRFKHQDVPVLGADKYVRLSKIYGGADSFIKKDFLFNIDAYLDIEKLKYYGFIVQ